jgi:hypothetical protein
MRYEQLILFLKYKILIPSNKSTYETTVHTLQSFTTQNVNIFLLLFPKLNL